MQFGEVVKTQGSELPVKVQTWFNCVTVGEGLKISRLHFLICRAGEVIAPIS